ncbi:hypothetical protein PBY51_001200 [Eleginops maclovinus]|uniref:Riboflavin transporter n=1 Tax=Eleginops maclovinus TaxID=56733 RepID=A0AAN7XH61_ELEMC|nr:hypothetical protein PBY51_001200 [Eleginops maclovinus]
MTLLVHLLSCVFGLGSWVAVNGVWVELPLLVTSLPEGWLLPSYLTLIIQLANLGPLLVTLLHRLTPGRLHEPAVISCLLCLGVTSCILLAFFWDRTTVVGGGPHSTAFFVLTFFLSLVDCTSSVTFLPFMMQLPEEYVSSFFVGEGLSGFLPAAAALAQSVGFTKCVNSSSGNMTEHSIMQTEYLPPSFSTEVFFFLLAAMMCLSLAAFIALNKLPRTVPGSTENLVPDAGSISSGLENPGAEGATGGGNGPGEGEAPGKVNPDLSLQQLIFIYVTVVWVNGATNGLLPAVQTFSCKPYGDLTYHLSTALAAVANPAACTVAMFFPNRSLLFLGLLTALGSGFGGYNMAMAAMSPCPLMQGSAAGETIIVLSWLLFTGTLSYVKVMVGVILRARGHSALVWCGAAGQVGSLIGSVTMFPLVNVYKLFTSADFCSTSCPS